MQLLDNGHGDPADAGGSGGECTPPIHSIPFGDFIELLEEAINWRFDEAANVGQPYDSGEGGYIFSEAILGTYDVLDYLCLDVSNAVLDDIYGALPDHEWSRRDFWSLNLNEVLKYGWESFVQKVKHETRFVFTLPPKEFTSESPELLEAPDGSLPSGDDGEGPSCSGSSSLKLQPSPVEWGAADSDGFPRRDFEEQIPAYRMLEEIGSIVQQFGLVAEFPETVLYRARVEIVGKALFGPADFGPPPEVHATQPNRMSPSGIVMFYGALDRETAIVETFDLQDPGLSAKVLWLCRFRALRPLVLLDLTKLPATPSVFDQDKREQIHEVNFLHDFVRDLTEPISRDGREHVEYVPTQVVTEYFRHRFLWQKSRRLDGVLYRSSRPEGGKACVLFIDRHNCGVPAETYVEREQVLQLEDGAPEMLPGALVKQWHPTAAEFVLNCAIELDHLLL